MHLPVALQVHLPRMPSELEPQVIGHEEWQSIVRQKRIAQEKTAVQKNVSYVSKNSNLEMSLDGWSACVNFTDYAFVNGGKPKGLEVVRLINFMTRCRAIMG